MILVSDIAYMLFMASSLHLIVASSYAIGRINGENDKKSSKYGVMFCIGWIILLFYRQSTLNTFVSIPVYSSLSIVFLYIALDAINDGKRYFKLNTLKSHSN